MLTMGYIITRVLQVAVTAATGRDVEFVAGDSCWTLRALPQTSQLSWGSLPRILFLEDRSGPFEA
jgi:hypothetical protein